jgi:hypothetical protein
MTGNADISFLLLYTSLVRGYRNCHDSGILGRNSEQIVLDIEADESPTFSHFSQVPYQRKLNGCCCDPELMNSTWWCNHALVHDPQVRHSPH